MVALFLLIFYFFYLLFIGLRERQHSACAAQSMDDGAQGRQYGRLPTGISSLVGPFCLGAGSLLPRYRVFSDTCEVDIYQREEDIRLKVPLEGAPDTDGSGTRLRINMICGRYGFFICFVI